MLGEEEETIPFPIIIHVKIKEIVPQGEEELVEEVGEEVEEELAEMVGEELVEMVVEETLEPRKGVKILVELLLGVLVEELVKEPTEE